MAIHVFIDGEFFKRFESAQEINEKNDNGDKKYDLGMVMITKSEPREDGDGHNLYMETVKEEKK